MNGITWAKMLFRLAAVVAVSGSVLFGADNHGGIDPEALIDQIVATDIKQRSEVSDVTLDAEYIEGKPQENGDIKEERRFLKRIYLRNLPDTTLYHEELLGCFKEGAPLSAEECAKEFAKYREKRSKRKTRNIAYRVLAPFYPESRSQYEITYHGIADEKIDGHICHHFSVRAKESDPKLINGEYYFEAESFHLVRVDFSPAKLVKKTMFRLNRLEMTIQYKPTWEGWWLPHQFTIVGAGKAAFLFGVKFAVKETYRNPQVNTGVKAEIFEVNDGK